MIEISLKILIAAVVLIVAIWMMANQDKYIDKSEAELEPTEIEDWYKNLSNCQTIEQAIEVYQNRACKDTKANYAFFDKMNELEHLNKLKREVLSLN